MALPAALAGVGSSAKAEAASSPIVISAANDAVGFERSNFGTVGVFDVDWLTTPGFARLLDNLASSPGAFHGVRFFGALNAGRTEQLAPVDGGVVWPDPALAIDLSPTFDALHALTSRGLTPFVSLGFFPQAVSASPIQPPGDWTNWQTLVRTFFAQLIDDRRFGASAIESWWFEVWNEPNEGRFWSGTPEEYLTLYRTTSEVVTGLPARIRLGGPAIAYKPQVDPESGAPWIERFLQFIAADPSLRCDFVSFHRKGTVGDDPPDPRRLHDAAVEVAELALAIDSNRFHGLTIVNDEADEKVGFETPYAPRMSERNAAWLAASASMHAALDLRYRDAGFHFIAAADNANLQLVQAPFDGRRSIMTIATPGTSTDLLKIPAYGFYELLKLMGDRQILVRSGGEQFFPDTDLSILATASDASIALLLAYYPDVDVVNPAQKIVDLTIEDIPWPNANIARFQIDRTHSNAYRAAGGSDADPWPAPDPALISAIRLAQEITIAEPVSRNIPIQNRRYGSVVVIRPYTTFLMLITAFDELIPASPAWIESAADSGNVVVRWEPRDDPGCFSFELWLMDGERPVTRLTPDPMRAALWIDTRPPRGTRVYGVRAVSPSGIASPFALSRLELP